MQMTGGAASGGGGKGGGKGGGGGPATLCGGTVACFDADADHVLLYTLGKTASTSLEFALGPWVGMRRLPWITTQATAFPRGAKIHRPQVAKAFVSQLPPTGKVWLFVTVRNPFDRAISQFFEGYAKFMNVTNSSGPAKQHDHLSRFSRLAPFLAEGIVDTIPSVIGANVTIPPLSPVTKDAWLVHGRVRVLILRSEDAKLWPSIVYRRTGRSLGELGKYNIGMNKWYATLYHNFKGRYTFKTRVVAQAPLEHGPAR